MYIYILYNVYSTVCIIYGYRCMVSDIMVLIYDVIYKYGHCKNDDEMSEYGCVNIIDCRNCILCERRYKIQY